MLQMGTFQERWNGLVTIAHSLRIPSGSLNSGKRFRAI